LVDRKRTRALADGSLVLITVVWGTTFVVVKLAVETVDPLLFIALRFLTAAVLLAVLYRRRLARAPGATWAAGGWLGLALLVGFALQTLGLRETTPARAAFITGLSVVMVPVVAAAFFGERPGRLAVAGVAVSFAGLVVLSAPAAVAAPATVYPGDASWRGDALVLGCAVAFALHLVGVSHFAGRHDARAITVVQVAVVGLLAGVWAAASGAPLPPPGPAWVAVAYMGTVATALVFLLQNWAQIHTTSTHAALIFALEPVFAALFSFLLYGEQLGPRSLVGGGLILAGMVLAELRLAED
jgi:drug/metabolite transporter (DMT)-like permease